MDHASEYVDIRHPVALTGTETIKAKLQYEQSADLLGVKVEKYNTDNGVFTSQQFMEHLAKNNQSIRFAGASAAHQNGVAECGIRTMMDMARNEMIQEALHAEGVITTDMWPMAMDLSSFSNLESCSQLAKHES